MMKAILIAIAKRLLIGVSVVVLGLLISFVTGKWYILTNWTMDLGMGLTVLACLPYLAKGGSRRDKFTNQTPIRSSTEDVIEQREEGLSWEASGILIALPVFVLPAVIYFMMY